MKKIIISMIALLFVVFGGCTKDEKTTVANEKIYVIGTNAEYPPYEYLENNKVVGFDADIIEELSKRVGFNYKWSNMNFDGLISALQAKKVDMIIAGMTVTEERKNFINFSTPYIAPNICYIVLKNNNLKNSNELQNKKFGVELGTTEEGIARQVPGAQVIPFTGHTSALLALKANKIDAMLLDESVAQKYIENNPEIESIGVASGESKAMAFNKSDEELKNKIDAELKKMLDDGTIQSLKEKYGI